jgi:plasmid maintenance system killer protein
MILSFDDEKARKIFAGVPLTHKECGKLGGLHIPKAEARLQLLHQATEKNLLTAASLHYHALSGTARHSIDADSRKSKWRITFTWQDATKKDVQLVRIEDTHK